MALFTGTTKKETSRRRTIVEAVYIYFSHYKVYCVLRRTIVTSSLNEISTDHLGHRVAVRGGGRGVLHAHNVIQGLLSSEANFSHSVYAYLT